MRLTTVADIFVCSMTKVKKSPMTDYSLTGKCRNFYVTKHLFLATNIVRNFHGSNVVTFIFRRNSYERLRI